MNGPKIVLTIGNENADFPAKLKNFKGPITKLLNILPNKLNIVLYKIHSFIYEIRVLTF